MMELYRFTGALTGLVLSGGISLFFFLCSRTVTGPSPIDGTVFYMLIPSMLLFGLLFDLKFIWKNLMRLSKWFKPSYIGSAAFWTVAWPLCKMLSDILVGVFWMYTKGQFVLPPYMETWGFTGIIGYFIYQAFVGTGMGLMFYMVYGPVFTVISKLRVRLGLADPEIELSLRQEMAEFGFRK